MATIATIEGKRGNRYRAIVRKQGQKVSRTFSIRSDSKRWATKLESEIEGDVAGLLQEGHKHTLSQAIDRYPEALCVYSEK